MFLTEYYPDLSRTRIQGLIADGFVLINGVIPKKAGALLECGDEIEVNIPEMKESNLVATKIPLNIIYEDEQVIVINKPAGLVVHPSCGHLEGTLVQAVLAHDPKMKGIGGELRPGLVHRLDKDTSGVIILAKDDHSLQWLQDQFRLRKSKKKYIALVENKPPSPKGRIEAYIGRDPSSRQKMAVVEEKKGRMAITEFYCITYYKKHTLVSAHPLTGRTHQIRLHMAMVGCPIVGDLLYGYKKASLQIKRQFLHAEELSIVLPNKDTPTVFKAPLPDDLMGILEHLQRSGVTE